VSFEFGEDLFARQPLAAIQFRDAVEQLFLPFGFCRNHETRLLFFLVVFEAAEGSANDFAGRLVEASLDLLLDELFHAGDGRNQLRESGTGYGRLPQAAVGCHGPCGGATDLVAAKTGQVALSHAPKNGF